MTGATESRPVTAWLIADAQTSVWGAPSRLGEPLGGASVLHQACRRIAGAGRIDSLTIFCPSDQTATIRALAGEVAKPVRVVGLDHPLMPGRRLIHRKWSSGGWRGGVNESVWMDEWFLLPEMINFGLQQRMERIAFFPPDCVLLDPELTDRIIAQFLDNEMDMRLTFSQAAAGLGCLCIRIDLIRELHQANACVSDLLGYLPDSPHADYIMNECCCKVDSSLFRTPCRFLTDTRRAWRVIDRIYRNTAAARPENWRAAFTLEAFGAHAADYFDFPRELELELNTGPSRRIVGYPHGTVHRPDLTLERFAKIAGDCAGYDDICLTLGGFGEPARHPDLCAMIGVARERGILGIHVETDGLNLDDDGLRRLVMAGPDIVSVYLDADSPELYRQVKGADGFDRAVHAIETLVALRRELALVRPLIVPHLVKTRATMPEMESFYDRWKRQCTAAVVEGYNSFAGQIQDQGVMNMAPPRRRPCRRLASRMTILADGAITPCSQDFRGRCAFANVMDQPLAETWNGPALQALRQAHQEGRYHANPLCEACQEWHRG